jgi:hypothetical protein
MRPNLLFGAPLMRSYKSISPVCQLMRITFGFQIRKTWITGDSGAKMRQR